MRSNYELSVMGLLLMCSNYGLTLSGLTKQLNFFFMYTFVNWVRVYIEDHVLSIIDFVDWLFGK